MDLSIGSEAWIVPGFSASSLIAVKVRLEGITPECEYWVDEPIPHPIPAIELHTRQGAYVVLRYRILQHFAKVKSEEPNDYDFVRNVTSSLFKFRIYQLNLTRYIWEERGTGRHPTFSLTDKRKDRDWFVIEDIDEREVDRLVGARITNDWMASHGR